jgi:SSS family solute:Na+ symporter|tara:strand:- start:4684 stop:6306 length:1623 start_codon:yes stop_codon:yes gene_type:complete
MNSLDYLIVGLYAVSLIAIATYVSMSKKGEKKTAEDYFLAGRSLPWWAIGASLIAANISSDQLIGMNGDAYAFGIAIATYEWTAAVALIVIGKFLLPVYLKQQVFTMPQLLLQRFDKRVSTMLAILMLIMYVMVILPVVLWMGAKAINNLTGLDLILSMILLGALSLAYSLYGGLKSVAMTDIIQVALLVFSGLYVSYLGLNAISDGNGVIEGFMMLQSEFPEKFDAILSYAPKADDPEAYANYVKLPGIWVLIGGLWIGHFYYWGTNQYITQRALGAKSLNEAQNGLMFAGVLKIFMPIVVVLPGLIAVALEGSPNFPSLINPENNEVDRTNAYPSMLSLLPNGMLGLAFAALIAAIVSSLASLSNSVSTIFTMDIYRKDQDINDPSLVNIGRAAGLAGLVVSIIVAPVFLGSLPSAFQYVQEYMGLFSPVILFVFLSAIFVRTSNSRSVLIGSIAGLISGVAMKLYVLNVEEALIEPFFHQMLVSFGVAFMFSYLFSDSKTNQKVFQFSNEDFRTSKLFNAGSIFIIVMLVFIYTTYF